MVQSLQIEIVQVLWDCVDGTHEGTVVTLEDDAEVANREGGIQSHHHPACGTRFAMLDIVGDLNDLDLALINCLMIRLDMLSNVSFQ